MKRLVLWAILSPLAVAAQVHKCQIDGKITYTEAPCSGAAKGAALNIRPSSGASDESKERTASMRTETIQLMLSNGKITEAMAYARTPDERAMVQSAANLDRQQRKDTAAGLEAAQRRHQREVDKGQKVRSVLR